MSVVLSASIFPKEEADIREKKHISSDGKFNALYLYSLHYYSTILLSVLLLGTVVSEREVKQRSSYERSAAGRSCKYDTDCQDPLVSRMYCSTTYGICKKRE